MEKKVKEFYEKPAIVKHSLGQMNRFGRVSSATPHTAIDGVSVRELIEQYGSPLWVLSEATLRRKYREFYRAFSLRYPKVVIAYSYKTNYLSGVCAVLHQEGAWAEVVSGFEYTIAEALGIPGPRIVFNGPHKTEEQLLTAIERGSRINVDSYEEIYLLEELAKGRDKPVEVGVRVNMSLGYPPWTRFGFHLESGQALEACQRIISSPVLRLVGLHAHLGTFLTDTGLYKQAAEKLVSLCYLLQEQPGVKLEYLDVGGGYASRNTLHYQYLPSEQLCPTFDQYAEAICPALLRGPFRGTDTPMLILEPGRSLVDEAMYLLTSVVSNKRLASGEKGVVVDAGVNLLPTSYWFRHEIQAAQEVGSPETGSVTEPVNIYGPLCMQIDVLQIGTNLPSLRRGDILVIKNVGAYNFSQSMQFIQPRPAVVLVNEGETEYLRLPETSEYLRQLEKVPERLLKREGSPV